MWLYYLALFPTTVIFLCETGNKILLEICIKDKSRSFYSSLNMLRNTQTPSRVLVLWNSKQHMNYNGEFPERLSEPRRTDQSPYQGISVSIWTSLWANVTNCGCITQASYFLLKVDVARKRWWVDWMFNWLIACLVDWLIDRLVDSFIHSFMHELLIERITFLRSWKFCVKMFFCKKEWSCPCSNRWCLGSDVTIQRVREAIKGFL